MRGGGSVLEEVGGFSSDTLAEDQDLTIQVRKLDYHVGYEEDAIGLTEAPDTFEDTRETAVPLVVRHASVHVEAQERSC